MEKILDSFLQSLILTDGDYSKFVRLTDGNKFLRFKDGDYSMFLKLLKSL